MHSKGNGSGCSSIRVFDALAEKKLTSSIRNLNDNRAFCLVSSLQDGVCCGRTLLLMKNGSKTFVNACFRRRVNETSLHHSSLHTYGTVHSWDSIVVRSGMLEKGEQIVASDDSGRDKVIERRHGCIYTARNAREEMKANEKVCSRSRFILAVLASSFLTDTIG
jgi:hypothetical protein